MNLVLERPAAAPIARRELVIDFMYLDLETCSRCRGTEDSLEEALTEVERVLAAAGVEVTVHKMLIESEAQARDLGFVSSPTIRVNGHDIALELRESSCAECGEACGCDGKIDCRVWVWHDREYTVAPVPMIVDAMLQQVYAGKEPLAAAPSADVPENVMRFLAIKEQKAAASTSCCSSAKQATCCDASEKASCCGAAPAGSCGCQAK